MSRSSLAKAAGVVAFLTVVSKVLGFFREASLAAVFGATFATDAYLVAQTIPYLLFATVSYALTTTFMPAYSHVREARGKDAAFGFARTVMCAVGLLGLLFVMAGEALAVPLVRLVAPGFSGPVAQLTAYLSRIIFPMMIFQLLSGIMTGMLQADGEFAVPTSAGLVQNIAIISSILFFGRIYGITAVAIGTLLGAGLAMVVKVPALRKLGFRWSPAFDFHDPGLRRMAVLMLPAVLGAGAGQLNTLVDRILASGLPEGRVAALSYANRLMQLAPGILGTSVVTVIYPTLATMAARREWKSFTEGLASALSLIHFLLMPVAVGVLVLREPLVRIVFQRGVFDAAATQQTAWALLFLSLGIAIFTMRDLVSRAFFTLQDTTTPMLLGMVTVAINIVLNLLLVGPLEQGGLALATTAASLVGLVLGLWAFHRKSPIGLPGRRLASSVFRTGLASALMGAIVWFAYREIGAVMSAPGVLMELTRVLLTATVGAGVYLMLVWALRVAELQVVVYAARQGAQRFRRRGGQKEA
jgi:putative peptidoglycan lipid II flippase